MRPSSLLKFFSDTSWSSGVAEEYDGRVPVGGHLNSFLRCSVVSRPYPAGASGWTNEVWCSYPHPTTNSSPATPLQHTLRPPLNPSDPTMRCSGTGRDDPAGPCRSYVSERIRSSRVRSTATDCSKAVESPFILRSVMNRFTQKVMSGGIAAGLSVARRGVRQRPGGAVGGVDPQCARGRMAHDGP